MATGNTPETGWKESTKKFLRGKAQGNYYKFQDDENIIRILPDPRAVAENNFSKYAPLVTFRVHQNVGPNKRFIRCGKSDNNEGDCWLCDVRIPYLLGSEKEQLRKKGKDLQAVDQVVFNLAWLEDGKWQGPKPLFANIGRSTALGNRIMTVICGPKPYDHPTKGRNLVITRTGQGLATRYGDIAVEDDPSTVPTGILGKVKPLEEVAGTYSKEFMMLAYEGREQELETEAEEPPVDEAEDAVSEGEGAPEAEAAPEGETEGQEQEGSGEEQPVEEEQAPLTEDESTQREAAAEGESYAEFQQEGEQAPVEEAAGDEGESIPEEESVEEAPVQEEAPARRPSTSKPVPAARPVPAKPAPAKPVAARPAAPAAVRPAAKPATSPARLATPAARPAAAPAAKPAATPAARPATPAAKPPAKYLKPGQGARKS